MDGIQIALELTEAERQHAEATGAIVSEAWRRRAIIREDQLRDHLINTCEAVECGGRIYSIGLDGNLRVAVAENEQCRDRSDSRSIAR